MMTDSRVSEEVSHVERQQRNNLSPSSRQHRQPKPDRRKIFVTVLAVVQIILGSLYLCLGIWSIFEERNTLLRTGCVPFMLACLCYICGYLANFASGSSNKKMVLLSVCVPAFACLLSLTLVVWMFLSVVNSLTPATLTSYRSYLMGLCILLMLDSGIIAACTWTLRETLIRRRRHRRVNRDDPPPAYFTNRMMYFNEGFSMPITNIGDPPPYQP